MKASHKADLATLLSRMRIAVDTFAHAARTLGVETLIDYANRTIVYVEACKAKLDREEDFSDWDPRTDALSRLYDTEQALARTQGELTAAKGRIASLELQREDFRAQAYQTVQNDLQRNRLWIATDDGNWLPPTTSGLLVDAVDLLLEARKAPAAAPPPPGSLTNPRPATQNRPAVTQQPQDFRSPAPAPLEPLPAPPAMPAFDVPSYSPSSDPAPSSDTGSTDSSGGGDWSGGGGSSGGAGSSGEW